MSDCRQKSDNVPAVGLKKRREGKEEEGGEEDDENNGKVGETKR